MKNITKRIASTVLVLVLITSLLIAPVGGALALTALENTSEEALAKWDDDGVLKILGIGNSFSIDTFEYAYSIAKSAGIKEIVLGNLYIAGCSIDQHLSCAKNDKASYIYYVNSNGSWKETSNYKLGDAIRSDNWDYITLQQASGDSGLPESYSSLGELVSYVRKNANDDATLVWNMTWAYQQSSTHDDFENYNDNQLTMYNAIVNAVSQKIVDNDDFEMIIPVGTTIQNARTSYIGDTLTRDGFHLTYDLGRYMAGLTLVKQLTGISIDNIGYRPASVAPEYKEVAIESVNNAIANPLEITKSTQTTAHTFGQYAVTVNPTCTEYGEKAKTCSVCGKTVTDTVAPTGHTYGNWVVEKEATDTEEGSKYRKCSICGNKLTVAIPIAGSAADIIWDFKNDCSIDFESNIIKFAATTKANALSSGLISYNAQNLAYEMKYPSGYYSAVGLMINKSSPETFEVVTGYKFDGTGDAANNSIIPGVVYAKDENGLYSFTASLIRSAGRTYIRRYSHYFGCNFGSDGSITMNGGGSSGTGTIVSNKDIGVSKIVVTENQTGTVITNEDVNLSFNNIKNDTANNKIRIPTDVIDLGAVRNRYNVIATADGTSIITTTIIYSDGTYTYEYTLNECLATAENIKVGSESTTYDSNSYYNSITHAGYETACGVAGSSAANSYQIATQVYSVSVSGSVKCEHSYVKGETTAPTCEAEGFTIYTCSLCGNSYKGDTVAAFGHDLSEATVNATCTTAGSVTTSCSRCDYSKITAIPSLGHTFSESAVTKQPSCTEPGTETGVCVVCGETAEKAIPAMGHDLSSTAVDSTCSVQGSVTTVCSRCDYKEVEELPLAEHSYGDWVIDTPATEESEGSKHKECLACGNTVTETIPMVGAFSGTTWDFTGASGAAQAADAIAGATHVVASKNGGVTSSTLPMGYDATSAALELKTSNAQGTSFNGLFLNTPAGGTPTSFNVVTGTDDATTVYNLFNAVMAYAEDDTSFYGLQLAYFSGFKFYHYEIKKSSLVASANGYEQWSTLTYSRSLNGVAPSFETKTKNGVELSSIPTGVLGNADVMKAMKTEYDVQVADGVVTITPKAYVTVGSDYYEFIAKPVTITNQGVITYNDSTTKTITVGENYENVFGVFSAWNGGNTMQIYSMSADYGVSGGGDVHTHSYTAVVTAPTCEDAGYTTYTCSCGDSYTADETADLGHDLKTETVAATCVANGYVTTACSRCDYVESEAVPALGHDYTVSSSEDATCTEQGIIMETCSRCGDAKTTTVPATGHNHTAYSVVEPTCTEAGFTIYTCSACSDTYTAGEVAALGHDYVTATTQEPTCTHEGLATTTCSRCDYESVATIPALDHTESDWIIDTPASDTEEGSKHTECTVCGQTLKTETIPVLGSGDEQLVGDSNGDGAVNVADAVLIAKLVSNLIQVDDSTRARMDVNGDGTANVVDAVLISRYAAGLIKELPVK